MCRNITLWLWLPKICSTVCRYRICMAALVSRIPAIYFSIWAQEALALALISMACDFRLAVATAASISPVSFSTNSST